MPSGLHGHEYLHRATLMLGEPDASIRGGEIDHGAAIADLAFEQRLTHVRSGYFVIGIDAAVRSLRVDARVYAVGQAEVDAGIRGIGPNLVVLPSRHVERDAAVG